MFFILVITIYSHGTLQKYKNKYKYTSLQMRFIIYLWRFSMKRKTLRLTIHILCNCIFVLDPILHGAVPFDQRLGVRLWISKVSIIILKYKKRYYQYNIKGV